MTGTVRVTCHLNGLPKFFKVQIIIGYDFKTNLQDFFRCILDFLFCQGEASWSTPVTSQVSVALRRFLVWFYECRKFCGDDVNGAFIALLI